MSRVLIVLGAFFCFQVYAIPEQCLQAPERIKTCPHLLYKKAAVGVSVIGVEKGQVICICLTDLQAVKNKRKNSIDEIERQKILEKLALKYEVSQEEIIKLVKL